MLRLLKPNRTGVLLLLAAAVVIGFPRGSVRISPSAPTQSHVEIGIPVWISWDTPGTWHLHAAAIPSLLLLWCLPMLLGAALQRWTAWERPRRILLVFAVLPVLSLVGGVAFSQVYWGFPWSLPALDSRLDGVRWSAIGSFVSGDDGSAWLAEPRSKLSNYRTEPAEDLECCETGRILKVVRARQTVESLPELQGADVRSLESEVSSLVALERGEPGYEYARRLRGVLVVGTDSENSSVAFASFTGGEVSNDHHASYEVFWRRGQLPQLLSVRRYYGDVAGMEGMTALSFGIVLLVLGLVILPVLIVVWTTGRAIVLLVRRRRPASPTSLQR